MITVSVRVNDDEQDALYIVRDAVVSNGLVAYNLEHVSTRDDGKSKISKTGTCYHHPEDGLWELVRRAMVKMRLGK